MGWISDLGEKTQQAFSVGEDLGNWWDSLTGATARRNEEAQLESKLQQAEQQIEEGKITPEEFKQRAKEINQTYEQNVKQIQQTAKQNVAEMDPAQVKKMFTYRLQNTAEQAMQKAAQVEGVDPQQAQNLRQIADTMTAKLRGFEQIPDAQFNDYLTQEAQKLGAPSGISPADVVLGSTENFAQIGSDPQEAQRLQSLVQTTPASVTEVDLQFAPDQVQAAETARQIGMGTLQGLQQRAEGPTVAEDELRFQQASQRVQEQLAGQAASQRGQYDPAMQRELLRQQSEAGQAIAGQQAVESIQETQRRQEALAGLAGQQQQLQYGQGFQTAATQAELAQQRALAEAGYTQEAGLTERQQLVNLLAQQAGFQQQAAQLGQQQQLQQSLTEAELAQQAQAANQAAMLQQQGQQAQLGQQANMAQLGFGQQQQLQGAQFQQQALLDYLARQQAAQQFNAQMQFGAAQNRQAQRQFATEQQLQQAAQQQGQLTQQQQLQMQQGQATGGLYSQLYGQQAAQQQQQQQTQNQLTGGLASAGATGLAAYATMAASDQRVKENYSEYSDEDFEEFLSNINPGSYNYKDPDKHGEGVFSGYTAQDMEKSKIGKTVVREGEDGTKMINLHSLQGAQMGAIKYLYDKIQEDKK